MGQSESSTELARLRWRCRRGMRELEFLLARYLDSDYPRAPAVEQAAFARLLELQDPVLWGLLLGREQASDPELAHVVDRITHNRVG